MYRIQTFKRQNEKKKNIKEDTVDDVKEITMDKTQKRDKEMKEQSKTDTGKDKTPVEMNPKMNHKF
ncbi:MAG: hypothetical protein CM15mV25_1320 [uncultured marine virus]|nr:MAG: hypothetical protein CM15mV25_1320 [uncultured marine virus]